MAGTDRNADDRLSYFGDAQSRPWSRDFYMLMRRVEGLHPQSPRIGEAARPHDEPVRLGQTPSLSFAQSNVDRISWNRAGRMRISVRFLGLFGPNGPLPLHLTELAQSRIRHQGDETFARFADVFHHRQLSLFYRAWRQAQPTASRDRPQSDRFMVYLGALIGEPSPAWAARDRLGDENKRFFAAILGRASRNAEGLVAVLRAYFGVPVGLQPYAARWMNLPATQRTRLGDTATGMLGQGAVLGSRVLDAQHHIRLRIGPLALADYQRLLPGGPWHGTLADWIRRYCDDALGVQATLVLSAPQVPALRLGAGARLGWTSWLGAKPHGTDADDLDLPMATAVG